MFHDGELFSEVSDDARKMVDGGEVLSCGGIVGGFDLEVLLSVGFEVLRARLQSCCEPFIRCFRRLSIHSASLVGWLK